MSESSEVFLRYVMPHWKCLQHVARRYATAGEDAHDLVQETLLRAWRGFSPTKERTYRRAWLFVIMRNVALDWQRTSRRRVGLILGSDAELTEVSSPDPSEPFADFPTMDEARFRDLLDEHVAAAFDGLEGPFREVVLLSVAGELTYREIAEVLDCPVGTVMSRMARARRSMREHLSACAGTVRFVREKKS